MNRNVLFLIGAIVLFILGIFVDEYSKEMLYAGLAAFAASHLP